MLRSLRQWKDKKKADLQSRMDVKKKGSREWKRLRNHKIKFLRKVKSRTNDMLHKYTTGIVSTCKRNSKDTLVVGDLRGYRQDNNKGKERNQENHAWMYSKITWMLKYKAEKVGINFALQDEAYTSQTCPSCGKRKKPHSRVYRCRCGFQRHRDVVGAFNILKKYLSSSINWDQSVVADMIPASEIEDVKYHPYLCVA
jgi:putative transposase